jgi:hypothetical protein
VSRCLLNARLTAHLELRDSVQFFCPQAHILAGWCLETRLALLSSTLLYKIFARTTQRTQPLYFLEDAFTAPLHINGIVAWVFVLEGMCLPSRCLAINVYSDFTIPAFARQVTVSLWYCMATKATITALPIKVFAPRRDQIIHNLAEKVWAQPRQPKIPFTFIHSHVYRIGQNKWQSEWAKCGGRAHAPTLLTDGNSVTDVADLWRTKWRWGRLSPSTSVSPANLHSNNCSTITFTYHLGLVQ